MMAFDHENSLSDVPRPMREIPFKLTEYFKFLTCGPMKTLEGFSNFPVDRIKNTFSETTVTSVPVSSLKTTSLPWSLTVLSQALLSFVAIVSRKTASVSESSGSSMMFATVFDIQQVP